MKSFRFALAGLGLLACQFATADDVRFRLAYTNSANFVLKNGDKKSLYGPEFGIDVKIASLKSYDVSFAPSICLGGRLQHGSDVDGNVLRFLVKVQEVVPSGTPSWFLGAGISHTEARGAYEFVDVNGIEGMLGYAVPFSGGKSRLNPSLDFILHVAQKGALSGLSVGVSAGF